LRSDRERLLDILEAVDRIEAQAARGRAAFAGDELTWRQMVAMRNVLIHGYFDIDVDLVWSVVQNDLPKLAAQVRAIVDETR
jgi:uncharacterized protein with HEPN domain